MAPAKKIVAGTDRNRCILTPDGEGAQKRGPRGDLLRRWEQQITNIISRAVAVSHLFGYMQVINEH